MHKIVDKFYTDVSEKENESKLRELGPGTPFLWGITCLLGNLTQVVDQRGSARRTLTTYFKLYKFMVLASPRRRLPYRIFTDGAKDLDSVNQLQQNGLQRLSSSRSRPKTKMRTRRLFCLTAVVIGRVLLELKP